MSDETLPSPTPDQQTTPKVPPGTPESQKPEPKRPSIIKSSLIFSGLTLVSRFMGLARDLVITARLGASQTIAADAYYTALSFPNLFRRIFAEGAFAAAFVPAYSRKLAADGERSADELATDGMAALAAATIVLTVLCMLTMPWLMFVINPGYADEPDKFRLAWMLTIVTMPYLPCMAITALLSGVLNARGRFILSGAAPTVLNAAMLVAVIPVKDPVAAAWAASFGVLGAGFVQAGLLWWGARKSGAILRLTLPRLTPDVKALILLAIPGAIAASATQINIFISGMLASQMTGARSWLNVADRLYQLPLGMVGVAIGVALLPRLSQALGKGDAKDAQESTDLAIVASLALALPAAAGMMAVPHYLIDGLFTRGAFTAFDAEQTALALFHYGWGTPAFILARVLSPVFFARQDTKAPMRFALISVAINIVLGLALFHWIGFQGIAAATAVASWFNVGQMVFALHRSGDYRPSKQAWGKIARLAIASAILGALLVYAGLNRAWIEAPLAGIHFLGLGAKEIGILSLFLVASAVYPVLVLGTGGMTLAEIKGLVRRRRA
ncbi:murein biosynthesis integral membrane protein MurJ [Caulobacter sp. SLTY]|uniref:murein biosynthesis integral membrane protein MurJ n=1 Tax=Caulobacter sp. SLTY TaxID=2683262 RepID=UPI003211DE2B